MRILLILGFAASVGHFLVIREGGERDERQKSPSGITSVDGGSANSKGRYVTLSTVRCAEINSESDSGSQNKACRRLCGLLKGGFTQGECAAGFCVCSLDISDIIQAARGEDDKSGEAFDTGEKWKNEPGVRCANLIRPGGRAGDENHKGCGVHCRLLSPKNKDGHCVEGTCHCFAFQITKTSARKIALARGNARVAEDAKTLDRMRCGSGAGGAATADANEERKEDNRKPGSAETDVAHLADTFPERSARKCDRGRRSANGTTCREHCRAFSRDHTQGRCLNGVCRCGYAVYENLGSVARGKG